MTDLYHKHAIHARRAALAVLANGDDADDVVHAVFLRLFETLTDPPARPIGRRYIVTSARNRALNVARARKRIEELDEAGSCADNGLLPDRVVEQGELRAALEEEIALLPNRCRAVAELRFLKGRSHSEIAAELDISPKAVEKQSARANRRLRAKLKRFVERIAGGGEPG